MNWRIKSTFVATTFAAIVTGSGCPSSDGNGSVFADAASIQEGDGALPPDAASIEAGDAALPLDDASTGIDSGRAPVEVPSLSRASGSLHEHEPMVAVSPGGRVVVSWLARKAAAYVIGYRISNDRGETWGPATLMSLPPNTNVQANGTVATDEDDNLYLSWGSENVSSSGRSHVAVYATRSAPGTTAFETPVLVTDPAVTAGVYDLPRIAVGRSGEVHVVYIRFSQDLSEAIVEDAVSTDFSTWSRQVVAGPGTSGSTRWYPRICRQQDGDRWFVTYHDTDLGASFLGDGIGLRYSDDHGETWSDAITINLSSETTGIWNDCAARGNDVWILYGLSSGEASSTYVPPLTSVRVAHSGDRGATIDERVDVTAWGAGAVLMYPAFTVEETGSIDVSFYAGNAADDTSAGLWRVRSAPGGAFDSSALVYSPVKVETSRSAPTWIGDYTGLAHLEGDLYLAFTNNASQTPHIAFHRTPAALPRDSRDGGVEGPDAGGSADAGCYAAAPVTIPAWAPPTDLGQHACTAGQITAYLSCQANGKAFGDNCADFRADSANASCLACLETPAEAPSHGPVIVGMLEGRIQTIAFNHGGCMAHYDGDSAPGCCGQQVNDFSYCTAYECGTCSDWSSAPAGGPTDQCVTRAMAGECASATCTPACMGELSGVASACSSASRFVPAWCGP
ncbi:MAG: exo-alpha-sialidase [Deltaproteobacteria bacterium]|nr:exo-alpha-sialidase [Deltaproteobacteria bacterium]